MNKDEYSPYKIVHHPDKLEQLKAGVQTVPLQVQVVPSNKCNQRCLFCAYRTKGWISNQKFDEKNMLSYDKIKETLDCFVDMGVKAVSYTGGGEVLVHPNSTQFFIDTLDRKLGLSLVTNGMALNEKVCEILGDSDWVRVSVDSCSPETYSLVRSVSPRVYRVVLKNIELLVKNKRKNIIGVGFVINKENYKEVYDAAVLSKELGVDNFRISAVFTPMGIKYFDGWLEKAQELSLRATELSDDNFTVFNLFDDRIHNLFDGVQNYKFCPVKDLLSYIGADYNVYTCCTLAYNYRGLIGSIKNQSFKDLWNSAEKHDMFKKHNPSVVCRTPCLYENKNDFINYCIKKDPRHVNYI